MDFYIGGDSTVILKVVIRCFHGYSSDIPHMGCSSRTTMELPQNNLEQRMHSAELHRPSQKHSRLRPESPPGTRCSGITTEQPSDTHRNNVVPNVIQDATRNYSRITFGTTLFHTAIWAYLWNNPGTTSPNTLFWGHVVLYLSNSSD